MKKNYTTPSAVVFETLKDDYCTDSNISAIVESTGTTVGGYGDSYANVDGSGLID